MEYNPRKVFLQLFGEGDTPRSARRSAAQTGSILDLIADRTTRCRDARPPGPAVLDSYLETVREIERRLEKAGQRDLTGITLPEPR